MARTVLWRSCSSLCATITETIFSSVYSRSPMNCCRSCGPGEPPRPDGAGYQPPAFLHARRFV
eukprot:2495397-Lingulodinium_polyedra.AAC.1